MKKNAEIREAEHFAATLPLLEKFEARTLRADEIPTCQCGACAYFRAYILENETGDQAPKQ